MLMKKLFLFATVAAAGLFAGCSSSDDALSDSNPAIENVDGDENVPITIGIGNLANMTTRGTGTVGGVGTTPTDAYYVANKWYGQYINVFMFDKDENGAVTFNLSKEKSTDTDGMYDNRKLVTPGSAENLIVDGAYVGATPAERGEAMNFDASIKYYPPQGNFAFFGYHADNAPTSNDVDKTTSQTQWTIPFTIDGSQDLMTTKAVLSATEKVTLKGSADFYSAKAARKDIQPVLTFSHLLTRLQFNLFAGNAETAGYGKGFKLDHYNYKATITDAEYQVLVDNANITATNYYTADAGNHTRVSAADISVSDYDALEADLQNVCEPAYVDGRDKLRAIKVESIQVKSKNTGKMLVAWKDDDASATTVSYKMGVLTAGSAPSANWTETAASSGKYYWSSTDVVVPHDVFTALTDNTGYVDFSTLSQDEQAVAVAEKDVPAYKKIVWDATQEDDQSATKTTWAWLSLKQRASWKQVDNAQIEDTDVDGYAAAKADKETKETALTTAEADIATTGNLYTTLTNAIATLAAKKTALDDAKSALATAKSNLANANPTDANYADLQQAVTDAQTALDTAQGEYDAALTARRNAQNDYDQAKAVYNAAKKAYDAAATLADQLNPANLMAETISDDVYNMLSGAGQGKYVAVTNEMNTNLAPLAPTDADVQDLDYSGATVTFNQLKDASGNTVGKQIGDALLIAPNKYSDAGVVAGEPLMMKIKLSQYVPTNWHNTTRYEYKSQEYEVEIPLPKKKSDESASAFMINNSYNVNLWVYGFSPIKIETVINKWKDGGEIGVGED